MVVLINKFINIDNRGNLLEELINGSLALECPSRATARVSAPCAFAS